MELAAKLARNAGHASQSVGVGSAPRLGRPAVPAPSFSDVHGSSLHRYEEPRFGELLDAFRSRYQPQDQVEDAWCRDAALLTVRLERVSDHERAAAAAAVDGGGIPVETKVLELGPGALDGFRQPASEGPEDPGRERRASECVTYQQLEEQLMLVDQLRNLSISQVASNEACIDWTLGNRPKVGRGVDGHDSDLRGVAVSYLASLPSNQLGTVRNSALSNAREGLRQMELAWNGEQDRQRALQLAAGAVPERADRHERQLRQALSERVDLLESLRRDRA